MKSVLRFLRSSEDEAAFSLVETLVSLALLALLATLMLAAIPQLRHFRSASLRNDGQVELEALADYLEQTLSAARPLALLDRDVTNKRMFEADQDHVRFVAVVRLGSTSVGLREVAITWRNENGHIRLLQSATMRRISSDPKIGQSLATDADLDDDLDGFSIEYLQMSGPADGMQQRWLPQWADSTELPSAIRIRLSKSFMGQTIEAIRTFGVAAATH